MQAIKRYGALLLLALLVLVAIGFRLRHHFAWSEITGHEAALLAFVAAWPAAAAAAYVAIYIAVVAISLPVAELMTVTGGLMFGTVVGSMLAVIGASCGAVVLFLIARTLVCDAFENRGGPVLARVRASLERDGFSCLLALRLVPLVPFWITNLAPALVGMRLAPYATATFIGIIPVTVVFASIGSGLRNVLSSSERPHLHVIFSAPVLLPLLGLAVLALLPVAWRHLRAVRA